VGIASCRVIGGRFGGDSSGHQQLDERVPAQAIRTVQPTGCLTDRVEPLDTGPVILRTYPDAAHRVVRGRRNFNRCGGDVEQLQVQERSMDTRKALHDHLARQM
jgi:hypothetical protein